MYQGVPVYTLQIDIWGNIIAGALAGLVSGLLVSFTLWAIEYFSRPKFEIYDVGNGLAHFFYNRRIPIIIGGSYVFEHGSGLIEQSPRASDGGLYMGPVHDQVFSTQSVVSGVGLEPGENIELTYRYAPLRYWCSSVARLGADNFTMDPLALFNARYDIRERKLSGKKVKRIHKQEIKGWRSASVVLRPSATINL